MNQEDIVQINVVNWFKHNFPHYKKDIHHFANQRRCSQQQGRLLKRMGVTKGVSDLHLALPKDDYAGMWLELKADNGKPTKEQLEFIEHKNNRGYYATWVTGENNAKREILNYLGVSNPKLT
jgi:hypothetical protein